MRSLGRRSALAVPRLLVAGALAGVLACGSGVGSTSSGPTSTGTASPPPATGAPASTPGATATPAVSPSTTASASPAATCLALRGGTGARASITDVRVGSAPGRNRLVIQFTAAVPAWEMALNPDGVHFVTAAKGEPVTVAGSVGVVLRIRDLDWWNDVYASGRDLVPGFATLAEIRVLDDFEGQADIAIGLRTIACPAVTLLDAPPRLVVDFPAP